MNLNNFIMPVALACLGFLLIALEAFIPSAGVLGTLAAVALIAAIISAFWFGGLSVGTLFMAATLVAVAYLIQALVRQWPKTSIGKKILVEPPPPEELLPDRSELHSMVGRVGQALSLMLPSGYIEIDGKRFDASATETVEEGTWVEVQSVRNGTNLIVRAIDQETALRAQRANELGDNPTSAPMDEVVPDPFDE